ncbi:MAG TPA: DUF1731 domain-containing protein [Enteractinococcus helveticum]|uniref:DUF1731 domain-containing protein n=1 Tax=Enteractinococcus helveticum TaxID=1837282 RepID=A0A921FKK2_9MICC|nr:DUF1731 domain-containing protein [Enteractinococcus helveticum]HJF13714.1 DUF1731 domain-containing protein [Enteractinococcus helveticum]
MGFSRTQSIYLALPTETVWGLLAAPSAWLQFDDQLQKFTPVNMAGNRLQTGDTVKVVPKALIRGFVHAVTAPPATIITARENQEISWRQDQPGGHTQQRWMVHSTDDGGTMLTRHTEVVGPFAAPLGAALADPLAGDLGAVGARMFKMAGTADASQPLNIIAGGSGYLGSRLATRMLAAGKRVMVLSRNPKTGTAYPQTRWGQDDLVPLHEQLMDDAGFNIINLVGRRIGAKFTAKEVDALAASRIPPTETLRNAVRTAEHQGGKLHRWIQGSAVPLWDPQSTVEFTEETSPTAAKDGPDGMGQLVADWEAAAPEGAIIVRSGVVLGPQTEIVMGLAAMAMSKTRPNIDGFLPWVHEDDWVGIVEHLLTMKRPPNVVVAVAPQQTRLSEVITALAPGLGTRSFPVPATVLSIGMNIIRMEPGMLMGSTRARSEVLDDAGYQFKYPNIAEAADAVTL